MSKVTVTAKAGENHVVESQTSEGYGYVRVQQEREVFNESGWLERKTISALVLGTTENLKKLKWFNGLQVTGKVVIREQLVPFSKVNPDQHLKVAGDTKVICMAGESPIYRNTFFSSDVDAKDTLIAHTNTEEIRAAAAKIAAVNEEFSLND